MGAERLELLLVAHEAELDVELALHRGLVVRVAEPVGKDVEGHDRGAGVLGALVAVVLADEKARAGIVVLGRRDARVAHLRVALLIFGALGFVCDVDLELGAALRGQHQGLVEHRVAAFSLLEVQAPEGGVAHDDRVLGGQVCSCSRVHAVLLRGLGRQAGVRAFPAQDDAVLGLDEVWRRFLRVEDEEGLASIAGGLWIGSTEVVVLSSSQHRLTESVVGLS